MSESEGESHSCFANARDLATAHERGEPIWNQQQESALRGLAHAKQAERHVESVVINLQGTDGDLTPNGHEAAVSAYAEALNLVNQLETVLEESKPDQETVCPDCESQAVRWHHERGRPTGAATVEFEDPIALVCEDCETEWVGEGDC